MIRADDLQNMSIPFSSLSHIPELSKVQKERGRWLGRPFTLSLFNHYFEIGNKCCELSRTVWNMAILIGSNCFGLVSIMPQTDINLPDLVPVWGTLVLVNSLILRETNKKVRIDQIWISHQLHNSVHLKLCIFSFSFKTFRISSYMMNRTLWTKHRNSGHYQGCIGCPQLWWPASLYTRYDTYCGMWLTLPRAGMVPYLSIWILALMLLQSSCEHFLSWFMPFFAFL